MHLPDIIYLVSDLLGENDRARLAQVSRLYFRLVMPSAWRTVIGATQLFKLIPGVRVDTPGLLAGTETINIPNNLENVDFTRFQLYADFVEHLQLFKSPATVTKVNRWDRLLQFTNRNPLLPSLRSIGLGTYWPQSISHYAWIAAFISPSVRTIETHSLVRRKLPTISSEVSLGIFNLLIDRCPDLESLSIFVDPQQRTSRLEPRLPSGGTHQQGHYELLFEAIKHVRNLSCTSSMTDSCQDTFLLLSRLPKLEALQVYASQHNDTNIIPTFSLEAEAFSRLTNLTLYDFGPHATLATLNCLTSAAELTHLALEINHKSDKIDSLDRFYNLQLIPTICVRAPHLKQLSIRPILDDKAYVDIDELSLMLLAALPLKLLTMSKSRARVGELVELFPRIQVLRWPDLPVTLDRLSQFTKCQQLKHLSVKLDLSPAVPKETLRDRLVPPASPCVLESDYSNLDGSNQADTREVLSYLVNIWPKSVILQQTVPFDYPYCDLVADERMKKLNQELKNIRQLVKRSKCEDLGVTIPPFRM